MVLSILSLVLSINAMSNVRTSGEYQLNPVDVSTLPDCTDPYPTDALEPTDVEYRDRHIVGMPQTTPDPEQPYIATGVKIKGVEPPSSADTTRVALFTNGIPKGIWYYEQRIEPEESWNFKSQHIAIYVVPRELVTENQWEKVSIDWSDNETPIY